MKKGSSNARKKAIKFRSNVNSNQRQEIKIQLDFSPDYSFSFQGF